jgi:carotenoid cleavage dioxygenase-like enzyme
MTAHTASETSALAMPGRLRGLQSGAREIDHADVEVRGALPEWLRGNLLLNGPALWDFPGGSYRHWFDGQAMLHRIRLGDGQASYRSRYLQSEDYKASVAAGKPAFGGFGSPDPEGLWHRMRHFGKPRMTDNGAVVMGRIGTQWVAQTETPLLTRFDPDTLETLGRFDYDDTEAVDISSAHSITDADGTYWNVGVELGPKCTYRLFRILAGSRRREVVGRWSVPKAGYLHGFAMTPRHAIVWDTALKAQPLKFLFTGNAYIDNFTWNGAAGSRIHAVSLADGSVRSWPVPALMAFHAIQAFEAESGELVLDLCTSGPDIIAALRLEALRAGRPVGVSHAALRYHLPADGGQVRVEPIGTGFELPMVHGAFWGRRRARLAWGVGFDPAGAAPLFDRTVKIDLDAQGRVAASWQRPDAVQMEPLYVDRPGSMDEEDGVLLVPTLADADPATVVGVIDPRTMQALATLHLPQVVPFGFHAAWSGLRADAGISP